MRHIVSIQLLGKQMADFPKNRTTNSSLVIHLRGNFTNVTRDYFFEYVKDAINSNVRNVIVDCSGLSFISNGGLAAMLRARKLAQERGNRIYLTHVNSLVSDILDQTKFGNLLSVFPTTNGLLAKFELES